VGIEKIVDDIIKCVGRIKKAYLTGEIALGLEAFTLELVIIGTDIDINILQCCIQNVEKVLHRNIEYLLLTERQEKVYLRDKKDIFLIWENTQLAD